jgi:hypothetical protein
MSELKFHGAVEPHEPPKAPEDREWDADQAEKRIRAWAGGPEKENIDWSKYRQGFAWYNADDIENFSSYKLPHHDIIDDKLYVVLRGVIAAGNTIMGARGGVDIPDEDINGVKLHLAKHYHQFDRKAPWELKSYSFNWLKRPISEDEVKALRLVRGVAIHTGLSKRKPVPDLMPEDNLLRGGRSLRGALIDIDHASVMEVNHQHYKEAYGLDTLFPVGQVLDAEYEDDRAEFIASIWDDKVYELISSGKIKGCSVVEEYRNEQIKRIDGLASITEGSTFPLLALCLETEPAYPNTWVKPYQEVEKAKEVEIIDKGPLVLELQIPNTKTIKKYSLMNDKLRIDDVKLSDLEAYMRIMNEKFEALKEEVRALREEKEKVEKELASIKEDYTQLKEFGRAKPTGIIEAYPSRQKNKKCNHKEFLSSFPIEQDLRSMKFIPSDHYLSWALAVERNCSYEDGSHCPHYQMIRPYTISAKSVIVPRVNQETALSFIRVIRNALSKELNEGG